MKIVVYDFETPKNCFLASFYIPEEDTYYDFYINRWRNDLYALLKFLDGHKDWYFLGYNCVFFDANIIEFVLRNYDSWYDKSNLEISEMIFEFGAKLIDDQKYGIAPPFSEESLTYKQLDVPRIMHFFNDKKRVSLKQLEFEIRAENIENFEFDLHDPFDSEELVRDMTFYCHNDIKETYHSFKYVIGEVEHPLYKGQNKLIDRNVLIEELKLPCLNWDDVKIGAEWNKLDYCKMTGKKEWDLKPKRINNFYGKRYKQFFPNTVKFQSEELKEFIRKVGETTIVKEKQKFTYKLSETLSATIGRGGLHSNEKERMITPSEDEIFLQNDIGGQYPNAMRKYKIFPSHLGIEWNDMLVGKIERRLHFKSLYKKTKEAKYNSLQEMGKLSLNGGAYGRLNTTGDWQQDPCAMLQTTIGCQLEILMIVEALVLKGFNVTSINTDGWDCLVPKKRIDEYFGIVKYYEEWIGNKELGNVEFTQFEWMVQTSVNSYIAKKLGEIVNGEFIPHKSKFKDDEYKLKGEFGIWKKLNEDTSFRILAIAWLEYFARGVKPEYTITKHKDIFDFCARSNSGMTYDHFGYEGNKNFPLPKLIRYYVAKDGIKIKKIVKPTCLTNASDTNVQPADMLKTVCNRLPKEEWEKHLQNVNRQWYIDKVNEVIFAIEKGKKPNKQKTNVNQISLF